MKRWSYLFIALAAVLLVGLMLSGCTQVTVISHPMEVIPEKTTPITPRPKRCKQFLKEIDPDSWDPHTETYPHNPAWRKCMEVA